MRGQRRADPGQVVYGYQDRHGPNYVAVVAKLAAVEGEEREGVREYLRDDGSARALILLGELEKKWAAGHSTPPSR